MHEHVRRKRRERDGQDAGEALPQSGLLALQRAAGNRAVQRLVYNPTSGNVTGPNEYARQQIPWDKTAGRRKPGVPTKDDPTLLALSESKTIRQQIATGLNVEFVSGLMEKTAAELEERGPQLGDEEISDQLAKAAASHNRMIVLGTKKIKAATLDERAPYVMVPTDYLPEADDLPGVGANLRATMTDGSGRKYWEIVCTMIAVYKRDGIAGVRTLTGNPKLKDDIDSAVQALHDYYVGKGVQYDDTSTRFTVMNELKYKMIFSGNVTWNEVGHHVALKAGERYIFDIEGHTVMVTIKRDYGPYDPEPKELKDVYEPESDPKNFTKGAEFGRKVVHVWKGP